MTARGAWTAAFLVAIFAPVVVRRHGPRAIMRLLDAADDAVHDSARDREPWAVDAQVLVAPQDGTLGPR